MAAFDPATIRLQRELLDKTTHDLDRDRRLLDKQPAGSKSKMAERLRTRIAEAERVAHDLRGLLSSMEAADAPEVNPRAKWIADGRALLDFIEATPDLPLNLHTGLEVRYHPFPASGDDADRMATVDAIAVLLGRPVTTPDMPGSHYETAIRFGLANYSAIAVLKDYREESDAIQRLGRAALAEQARAANGGEPR